MYRLRAAASGSALEGMPRCVLADPAALNVMLVAASGTTRTWPTSLCQADLS